MRLSILAAAVLSAAAFVGSVQQAQASVFAADASADASGLTFRLIDLNPDDGIAPWVQFSETSQVGLVMSIWNGTESFTFQPLPGTLFNAPSSSLSSPDGLFNTSYGPLSTSVTSQMTAAELANLNPTTGSLLARAGGVGYFYGSDVDLDGYPTAAEGDYAFKLSPYTALVIEGNVSLAASVTPGDLSGGAFAQNLTNQGLVADVWANAFMSMSLVSDNWQDIPDDFAAQYPGWTEQNLAASFLLGAQGEAVADVQSWAGPVGVGYYNASAVANDVYFYFILSALTDVYAYEAVVDPEWPGDPDPFDPELPPVVPGIPEPSTYALMLLGLGGIAVAARQRRDAVGK